MKTILAYSGGLDTSLCIKWLQENYNTDVVTLTLELGQNKDMREIRKRAKDLGAIKTYSIDVRDEFVDEYINPAIRANALYEGKYPLSTALSRPLIARWLVKIAEKEKAEAVAHGSTGKGNDQVRFEVSVRALNPEIEVIAPIRESGFTRDYGIKYAKRYGIQIPVSKKFPYSIDENLWGRSIESGSLEDPMKEPKEDAFKWTSPLNKTPSKPQYLEIEFKNGIPVTLNGENIPEKELIQRLNEIGGKHCIGRIDMIEDRLIGIKSREVYECPAATIILEAHRELERLTLTRDQNLFKKIIDLKWAEMVYFGLWYDPLKDDLDAFIENSQMFVSGRVRLKLYRGNIIILGRESENSLYDPGLATYNKSDRFEHKMADGFIRLWGLPSELAGRRG